MDILWQKDASSNEYIDIFDIRGSQMRPNEGKIFIDHLFQAVQTSEYQKNNFLAKKIREIGNGIFGQGKYHDAMDQYNLAVSFASSGSAELGLAFGNRSSCFLRLQMLENCLADIELAKKTQYPEHLMHKLDARAAECSRLMADDQCKSGPHNIWEPKLSFNEHKEFAGVADCLKMKKNDEFGRHVVASCDLKIGQTILVERPYAATPPRENHGRVRCWYCFKECMNFISCKDCLGMIYCNAECMEKSFHKMECNRPAALSRKETFELVMRTIFKIDANFPDIDALMNLVKLLIDGKKPPNVLTQSQKDFCSLFQLSHNHEKLTPYVLERLRAATSVVIITTFRFPEFKRKYVSLKHRRFLQHLILHLFHVAEHAVEMYEYFQKDPMAHMADYEHRHFGRGMYPFACFIKHSCVPNICHFNVDDRLICKVIRPIKKGEQIFRSYIPGLYSYMKPELKKGLKTRYHYDCACIVCTTDDWDPLTDEVDLSDDPMYTIAIKPSAITVKQLRALPRSQIQHFEKKAIDFLLKFDRFHPVNDTMMMQNNLITMWHVLASRY